MQSKLFYGTAILMTTIICSLTNPDGAKANGITITEQTIEGEQAVVMENQFYKTILLPRRAMLPLTFLYKPTGKELFARRADLPTGIKREDGMILCLPWVGDSLKKGPSKGLLRTAQWTVQTQQEQNRALLEGWTEIAYNDPVSSQPTALRFEITVTGTDFSPALASAYRIINTGSTEARFIFAAHPRMTAGGDYQDGDYVFIPGDKCWIGDFKWTALAEQNIQPNSWVKWPMDDLIRFTPKTGEQAQGEFAYAFVPASWAAIGNNHSKEFIVFHAGKIKIGTETQATPYFCLLHRDKDYLLETSLSRALGTANWSEPWSAINLPAGQEAAFSLTFIPGTGLDEKDFRNVMEATPEHLMIKTAPDTEPHRHAFQAEPKR